MAVGTVHRQRGVYHYPAKGGKATPATYLQRATFAVRVFRRGHWAAYPLLEDERGQFIWIKHNGRLARAEVYSHAGKVGVAWSWGEVGPAEIIRVGQLRTRYGLDYQMGAHAAAVEAAAKRRSKKQVAVSPFDWDEAPGGLQAAAFPEHRTPRPSAKPGTQLALYRRRPAPVHHHSHGGR